MAEIISEANFEEIYEEDINFYYFFLIKISEYSKRICRRPNEPITGGTS